METGCRESLLVYGWMCVDGRLMNEGWQAPKNIKIVLFWSVGKHLKF